MTAEQKLAAPSSAELALAPEKLADFTDAELQARLLRYVSRTFALTIPALPEDLRYCVSNAYLLCRAVDTIEDDPDLPAEVKTQYCGELVDVVGGRAAVEEFSRRLLGLLGPATKSADKSLIRELPRVVAITQTFSDDQRHAIERCLRVMGPGMAKFQRRETLDGLADMEEFGEYCYVVAGVVGEMLTDLFCYHVPTLVPQRERLMQLAVRFGQGLQMTNILKDVWEDHARGACWLPRSVFAAHGVDLRAISPEQRPPGFETALGELIGVTRGHLRAALDYTLMIPREEQGIRMFCLWAIGMAVLNIRRLNRNRDYRSGLDVKISRRSVYATVITGRMLSGWNFGLRLLFGFMSAGLPRDPGDTLSNAK